MILAGRLIFFQKHVEELGIFQDKTIGDEGITVDFRFIKGHTSN